MGYVVFVVPLVFDGYFFEESEENIEHLVIDMDPFTSVRFNERVKARMICTADTASGWNVPWMGRVLVNPPGGFVADE